MSRHDSGMPDLTAQPPPYQGSPPPYTPDTPPVSPVAQIDHDTDVVRLRNFLLHCLCMDYSCRSLDVTLSPSDQQIIVGCRSIIGHYYGHWTEPTLSDTRSQDLIKGDAHISRYIAEPCRALGVPFGTVLLVLSRYFVNQTACGDYKGCTYSVLLRHDVAKLAEKLYLDQNVILPCLLLIRGQRDIMEDNVYACGREVFKYVQCTMYEICPFVLLPLERGRLASPPKYTLREHVMPLWEVGRAM